jgi:isopentenyl phosphate kinase
MSEMVLLKLGGSVITQKESAGMIDSHRLRLLADIIGARKGTKMTIVHGAGSFGHPEARKFRIQEGVDASNIEGVYITHSAVRSLNEKVVDALRSGGCEAVGIHPLSGAFAEDGRLVSMECRTLSKMMDLGIVPVLHGDVVFDGVRGATIVSGDQLIQYLGRTLSFSRIGLATDVPGILDRDRVIPRITPKNAGSISIGDAKVPDVTGGMRGKVMEMLELARAGIPSEIFHVDKTGDFLDGKPHGGTVITGEEDEG